MARWDDDHAAFERPRRRSRPRTKERPDYSKAPIALVASIDRGRYRCLLPDGTAVTATKARILGRKAVIVGDRVRLDGDVSGISGTLARIVAVEERRTWLRRSADDADTFERPIVANADQLMIVTALADPEPRMGMIDRILVAAYDAKVSPVLCLTKADLASPADLQSAYAPLGVPIMVTQPGSDLTPIRDVLSDVTTVLIGHSGVGKSTLVNALVPGTHRATGQVSEVTGKGRHTSTSAAAIRLPGGGWIIDTPGVRSFGISHVQPGSFVGAFPDLAEYVTDCPRGCRHDSSAPECGLDEAVAEGRLGAERLSSFRRMERAFA